MMSDKYIVLVLFRSPASAASSVLKTLIELTGLSLTNPASKNVIVWTSKGSDDSLTPCRLMEQIQSDQQVAFQLWWDATSDVFCTFLTSAQFCSFYFALDGVTEDNKPVLSGSIFQIVTDNQFKHEVALLAFDYAGSTAEIDWDKVLQSGVYPSGPLPYSLIVPRVFAAKLILEKLQFIPIGINDCLVKIEPIASY